MRERERERDKFKNFYNLSRNFENLNFQKMDKESKGY